MYTISKKYTNNIISKKLNKTDWNDLKLKKKITFKICYILIVFIPKNMGMVLRCE